MKKVYAKLVAMSLLLVLSLTAVVSASYAWFAISENPVASGIQVSLSGGNTILIAPDISKTVGGVTYHIPGTFEETLNFAQHSSYDYLKKLGGLSPVSTADGIHWFIASFYGASDPEVQSGLMSAGDLRPIRDFVQDDTLAYANQGKDSELLGQGHYVYLDFWVVSPGSNYVLRISTGTDTGSYVIDLLDPEATTATSTGFTLNNSGITSTAASVRVGFLTSSAEAGGTAFSLYQASSQYDSRYTALRGVYVEPGAAAEDSQQNRFMIYEPNADAHPTGAVTDGSYVATYPVGLVNGIPSAQNVLSQTAVQMRNEWKEANGSLLIEQLYQTSLIGNLENGSDPEKFYTGYLQNNLSAYIRSGAFIKYSYLLGANVDARWLETMEKANASEDVYIVELERNVPQRIRMYIWLEGQDVDWDPSVAGNRFALSIEFAGGTN